jgi:hypothetical protein
MSDICKDFNVRSISNTPFESQSKSPETWGKCSAEAQEIFEKALQCVERNTAARGRNQRDWDAPCTEMDMAAMAHNAFWVGVATGAGAASTAVPPTPQIVAAKAAIWGAAGAAIGFGQAVTNPDNVTSTHPADYYSSNPLAESNKEEPGSL